MVLALFVALLVAFTILIAAAQRHGRLPPWMRGGVVTGAVALSFVGSLLLTGQTFAPAAALAPQWWNPFSSRAGKKADELPGARLFRESGCVRCHTIGAGKKTGPDLAMAGNRMRRRDLANFIADPDEYYRSRDISSINRGFPRMPPTGIADEDAEDVADFLIAKAREAAK